MSERFKKGEKFEVKKRMVMNGEIFKINAGAIIEVDEYSETGLRLQVPSSNTTYPVLDNESRSIFSFNRSESWVSDKLTQGVMVRLKN